MAQTVRMISINPPSSIQTQLERFRAKWISVRVKKTRQNKGLEPGSDSIRTDKALSIFSPAAFILRDASRCDAPQEEVLNPHGEEHPNAMRLEP
jgi:hypothetical protein